MHLTKMQKQILSIYKKYCKLVIRACKSAPFLIQNVQFEARCFVYAVMDVAAFTSGLYRDLLYSTVSGYLFRSKFKTQDEIFRFNKRREFYADRVTKKDVRADWFATPDISFMRNNEILCCCGAFGDILINPQCADDYINAPISLYGVYELNSFATQCMDKVVNSATEITKGIHQLSLCDTKDRSRSTSKLSPVAITLVAILFAAAAFFAGGYTGFHKGFQSGYEDGFSFAYPAGLNIGEPIGYGKGKSDGSIKGYNEALSDYNIHPRVTIIDPADPVKYHLTRVYVTPKDRTYYHTNSCKNVADTVVVFLLNAKTYGYTPCPACNPPIK